MALFKPADSLTIQNAGAMLELGLRAIEAGQESIDLRDVKSVDSVAVATLLAWQRAARKRGSTLTFSPLSANLQSLADLYGVTELLSPHSSIPPH